MRCKLDYFELHILYNFLFPFCHVSNLKLNMSIKLLLLVVSGFVFLIFDYFSQRFTVRAAFYYAYNKVNLSCFFSDCNQCYSDNG